MARVIWPSAVVILLTVRAAADGMFAPSALLQGTKPSSAAQKAVLIREGPEQVLLLQTTYQGPSARFAWVVPIPARPTEVFEAEPRFIQELFLQTEPRVITELSDPRPAVKGMGPESAPPGMGGTQGGMGGGMGGPPGEEPPVQVLAQMEVGDFKATVLSSRTGEDLRKWLQDNQYAVPDTSGEVFEQYTGRGWVFVALKMLDRVTEARPMLQDVPPLGLRFPLAERQLVFPLTISRLSAPPQTALLLALIGDGRYGCDTLPTVRLRRTYRLGRGQTYGDLRRRLACEPRVALLCEASQTPVWTYTDLGYRKDWAPPPAGLHRRHVTRYFGLLRPDEMRDLVFRPAGGQSGNYRVLVQRRGTTDVAAIRAMKDTRPMALEPGSQDQLAARQTAGEAPPLERRGWYALYGKHLLLALAVLMVGLATLRLLRGLSPGATSLILLAAVALATYGTVHAGMGMYGREIADLLDEVTKAADAFRADTGCYPATVADLAARNAPATGCDASGNPVPVTGWRGPYLNYVPLDPVGGEGLVCDVLNTRLIDLGGCETTVRGATDEQVKAAEQAAQVYRPVTDRYWYVTPAEVERHLHPYMAWLRGKQGLLQVATVPTDGYRRTKRTPGRPTVTSGDGTDTVAFIVDRGRGEAWVIHNGLQKGGRFALAVAPDGEITAGIPLRIADRFLRDPEGSEAGLAELSPEGVRMLDDGGADLVPPLTQLQRGGNTVAGLDFRGAFAASLPEMERRDLGLVGRTCQLRVSPSGRDVWLLVGRTGSRNEVQADGLYLITALRQQQFAVHRAAWQCFSVSDAGALSIAPDGVLTLFRPDGSVLRWPPAVVKKQGREALVPFSAHLFADCIVQVFPATPGHLQGGIYRLPLSGGPARLVARYDVTPPGAETIVIGATARDVTLAWRGWPAEGEDPWDVSVIGSTGVRWLRVKGAYPTGPVEDQRPAIRPAGGQETEGTA